MITRLVSSATLYLSTVLEFANELFRRPYKAPLRMHKRVVQKSRYAIGFIVLVSGWLAGPTAYAAPPTDSVRQVVAVTLRRHVLKEAAWALRQAPLTVTASHSPRSAGGAHDFFSEGDYWWPDPAHLSGPYVQRDGLTNPDNFTAHREALIRFSRVVGALGSAYRLTGEARYARQARLHLRAWFLDSATYMRPALPFAQAIQGRFTGRGIGIIDTIQLLDVVQAVLAMQASGELPADDLAGIQRWFARYLTWLTTHPYGLAERAAPNNHGTCWTLQVAAFARLTQHEALLDSCRQRYRTVLLPNQMAADGSFPQELKRTKPYGYSLFNLDAFAALCQVLSTPTNDLWTYQLPDGRGMKRGIAYLYPYVADKRRWPLPPDVMYWQDWPVAQPFLVLGAARLGRAEWLRTWQRLNHDPQVPEVLRNLPVRNPLLWLD
jgi:hypothetical protein